MRETNAMYMSRKAENSLDLTQGDNIDLSTVNDFKSQKVGCSVLAAYE